MVNKQLPISPQTKVGELLEAYPQLEAVLIELAPAFEKLGNPVLRRTVARVTSLAQAARVGGISVIELVKRLRNEVGQEEIAEEATSYAAGDYSEQPPLWYAKSRIIDTLDARSMIDAGEQPIGVVLSELDKLGKGQIYELITPFEPAPLIDKARERGMSVWVKTEGAAEFHTYFSRL